MKKIMFILLFISITFVSCDDPPTNNSTNYETPRVKTSSEKESFGNKVYVISQTFVTRKLNSPSTADYPLSDFQYNDLGNDKHEIIGYVDCKNNFNAEIRNNFNIVLKFNGGDWSDENNWEVTWLKFN